MALDFLASSAARKSETLFGSYPGAKATEMAASLCTLNAVAAEAKDNKVKANFILLILCYSPLRVI